MKISQINNSSFYLSVIPENKIKTNNFILDYENGKKKTNILTTILTKDLKINNKKNKIYDYLQI